MLCIINAFSANTYCGVRADMVIGPYNGLLDELGFLVEGVEGECGSYVNMCAGGDGICANSAKSACNLLAEMV